jgi:hypothetical protein
VLVTTLDPPDPAVAVHKYSWQALPTVESSSFANVNPVAVGGSVSVRVVSPQKPQHVNRSPACHVTDGVFLLLLAALLKFVETVALMNVGGVNWSPRTCGDAR